MSGPVKESKMISVIYQLHITFIRLPVTRSTVFTCLQESAFFGSPPIFPACPLHILKIFQQFCQLEEYFSKSALLHFLRMVRVIRMKKIHIAKKIL